MGFEFYLKIKEIVEAYTLQNYLLIIDSSRGLFFVITSLFIAIQSIRMMYGHFGERTKEILTTILWLIISMSLIQSPYYESWIYKPIIDIGEKLSSLLLSSSISEANQSIDNSFSVVFNALDELSENASLLTSSLFIFGIFILTIAVSIVYALYYFIIIGAMLALHILLTIGAFIMVIAAFPQVRSVLVQWIRQISMYILYYVFSTIIISIFLKFNEDLAFQMSILAEKGEQTLFDPIFGRVFFLFGLTILMLFQVPSFAGGLVSGVSTSSGSAGLASFAGGLSGSMASTISRGSTKLLSKIKK